MFAPLFVLLSALAVTAADDPKMPPKAPDGWKYVESKDKAYQILMPTTTTRSGTRTSTSNRGGLSLKQQINYATLADGTQFSATAATMSGAALKGLTIGDVYKKMFEGMAADGGTVSEPKEFEIAGRKGKEVFHTAKDKSEERLVLLVGKNRIYEMLVVSKDKTKLTDETANTFLKSLFLNVKDATAPAEKDGEKKPEAK
ncbi:hypothetical protein PX52LOC_02842 [Limnoglobus roseus]|uniref:DUF1795 domain-containing protein n=2 Tax=Limnoglobus roseus TaxID=2598579 RepID=A0A5C1AD28_9BACT|nr:hypothetical protein PX52LOC_02842 [Limnoglobus roseus]